jgi:hypothetical protein
MNRLVRCVLPLIAGLAAACGPFGRPAELEREKTLSGDPVSAILDVNVREGVQFSLRVTNNTLGKIELLFPTGQTHDFVVLDSAEQEVWRWSEGRMFTQALMNRILDSRGTLAIEAAWRAAVRPGRYSAIATVLSENTPLEQRVEFEVR